MEEKKSLMAMDDAALGGVRELECTLEEKQMGVERSGWSWRKLGFFCVCLFIYFGQGLEWSDRGSNGAAEEIKDL